ncbi:hypothetical protein D917_08574, partial [Trichinella nativa]
MHFFFVIIVDFIQVLHKPIDEQSRSFALRFLVLCVQRNPIWRDEFVKMLGPAMLSYFTGESQFPVGSDFVKTLFDLCVSCSHSGCPLICEVEILFQMLTSFQLWRNGLEQFAEALLLLANLLEASSENVTICNQFSLIKRLLNLICIYIRTTGKDFSSSLINAITRVVQAVLSAGIWFTEVSVVIEFLFYCHDASRVTVQYPFCNAFTWINLSLIETFVNGLLKIRDECENELLIKEPSLRPSSKGIETFPAFVRLKCEILHLLIAHMNNIEKGEQLTNVPNCDIHWEYLIVMLRQQVDQQTVGYLVELLAVTLHWFSDDQKKQFLNVRGFDLLRNQLYQLPTSITVINSLLQLVLGGQTSYFSNNNNNKFEDQQLFQDHISNLMTIDEFQTEALSVLVAQLECAIVDCTTFNSLIDLLTEKDEDRQQQVMVNVRGAWRRFAVSVFRKALLSAEEQVFKCAAVGFLELLMLADLQLYVGGKVVKQKLIRDELVNLLGELLTTYRQVSWLKRWECRKSSTSCRRHRRSSGEAGESEIMASRLEDRLVECLELCNNFILFMPPNVGPDNDEELLLFQSYFSFLIDLIPDSFLLTKDPPNGPRKRLAIFALVKNLFVFLVHPSILLTFRQLWDRLHGNFQQTAGNCCDCSRRFVMVEQLQRNPKAREVLKSFLSTLPEYRDLLLHIFCDFSVCTTLTEADKATLAAFLRLDFLQASSMSSKLSSSGQCKIELAPAKSSLKKFYHLTCSWVSGMFERKKRILQGTQARLHSTNEQASDVNRFTAYMHDVITSEYASFEHNSNRLVENVLWQWRFIEKSLCHPQGIFYSPKKWPNRWYLDPLHLPGYSRVRFTPDVMDNDSEFYRSQET